MLQHLTRRLVNSRVVGSSSSSRSCFRLAKQIYCAPSSMKDQSEFFNNAINGNKFHTSQNSLSVDGVADDGPYAMAGTPLPMTLTAPVALQVRLSIYISSFFVSILMWM